MNRYDYTTIGKRWDGKNVYRTLIYPVIPESDSDIYITVSDNDYLDALAYQYYKDTSLWWIIAVANNLGKGKLSLDVTKQLRIPTNITPILQSFKLANS
jgi:hypothetical protein